MTKPITTIEQFLASEVSNYSQCYNGLDRNCRCGCGGTYASTSQMINPRSEVNEKRVKVRLSYAKKQVISDPTSIEFGDTYINISKPGNKAFTFYFDELKEA